MRLIENQWIGPPELPEEAKNLPLAERVLFSRGFSKSEERAAFLSDTGPAFHDPFLFPDMETACAEILRAVRDGRKILVYGDYDADGITATSILYLFLKRIGASVDYIIPDRVTEGYGISENLFDDIFSRSPDLLITVDCGIANIDEIDRLVGNGVDVIVTDHHEVKETLPDALAVVSAKRADSEYPFRDLCGAGVALKLVHALCESLTGSTEHDSLSEGIRADSWRDYLDLAAIGTIADVVPLQGENRGIVKDGLAMIDQSQRPGIRAMTDLILKKEEAITSGTISYQFVPKINAAGRMGDAARAVELMIGRDPETVSEIAHKLLMENTRRQEIEAAMFEEAVSRVEEDMRTNGSFNSPIVVCGKDWHSGIVGILASRLVTRYRRSAIVFTEQSGQDGILKASARASADYNILEAIRYAGETIEQFGGHPKAAGITIRADKYEAFRAAIREYADRLQPEGGEIGIRIDAEPSEEELTVPIYRTLQALQPFGEDNREPVFILRKARIVRSVLCGQDKHLKIYLLPDTGDRMTGDMESEEGTPMEAIAFGFGDMSALYAPGRVVDILFSLRVNTWMSKETLSLNVVDLRFGRTGNLLEDDPDVPEKLYINRLPLRQVAMLAKRSEEELLPQKSDIRNVYIFLKNRFGEEICECDANLLAAMINAEYGSELHAFSIMRIIDIFSEAGLLSVLCRQGKRVCFHLLFVDGKVKLESTEAFQRIFDRER